MIEFISCTHTYHHEKRKEERMREEKTDLIPVTLNSVFSDGWAGMGEKKLHIIMVGVFGVSFSTTVFPLWTWNGKFQ